MNITKVPCPHCKQPINMKPRSRKGVFRFCGKCADFLPEDCFENYCVTLGTTPGKIPTEHIAIRTEKFCREHPSKRRAS